MIKLSKEKIKEKVILEKKDKPVLENDITKTLIIGLIGLVLILIPDTLNKIIGIIVGACFLILGISAIYKYMNNKEEGNLNLITGILYSVLGGIIILYPHSVLRLVAICLGVYLLISGLSKVRLALMLKDDTNRWIGTLSVAILILVLGILLVFNPFSGVAITKLAGAFLFLYAIFDIIDKYVIQK